MEPKVHAYYSLIYKPIMCTTRGECRLISIRCQKECVESKLDGQTDSHRIYSTYLEVVQNFDILKILLLLIISICIFLI